MQFLITLTCLCSLLAASAHAQVPGSNERYRVRKGDTLELLGAEYYGNRVHKIYIMVENGLDHDKPLKRGQRLRIPVSQRITTSMGDTLAALAETYLGNASRAEYLAEFNHLDPNTSLALGQIVTIPMRVNYRSKGKEKLHDVALSLFADAKQAKLLRQYNNLESDELQPGQIISVPVPKVHIQASKHRPAGVDASKRAARRREMLSQARSSLPKARTAWRNGEFDVVKHLLTKLEIEYLDTDLATEAGVLLGSTYIAFADDDSALAVFRKVLQRKPAMRLSPRLHSPKVRAIWQQALENP